MNAAMTESVTAIANHYAQKISAKGMQPTQAEIAEAINANWPQIQREIAALYTAVTQ